MTERQQHHRILITLRCANPDCRQNVAQAHFAAPAGTFRVLGCPKCGQSSEYTSTATGILATVVDRDQGEA